jgi:hypothetical protein
MRTHIQGALLGEALQLQRFEDYTGLKPGGANGSGASQIHPYSQVQEERCFSVMFAVNTWPREMLTASTRPVTLEVDNKKARVHMFRDVATILVGILLSAPIVGGKANQVFTHAAGTKPANGTRWLSPLAERATTRRATSGAIAPALERHQLDQSDGTQNTRTADDSPRSARLVV